MLSEEIDPSQPMDPDGDEEHQGYTRVTGDERGNPGNNCQRNQGHSDAVQRAKHEPSISRAAVPGHRDVGSMPAAGSSVFLAKDAKVQRT